MHVQGTAISRLKKRGGTMSGGVFAQEVSTDYMNMYKMRSITDRVLHSFVNRDLDRRERESSAALAQIEANLLSSGDTSVTQSAGEATQKKRKRTIDLNQVLSDDDNEPILPTDTNSLFGYNSNSSIDAMEQECMRGSNCRADHGRTLCTPVAKHFGMNTDSLASAEDVNG
ncbi:hypothetical protein PVAP13_9KG270013 [Panicum virgatum]|uniref:Uncharacterized protein n=3 Tax=Panicum virgatum TaxID=38727 RepID=A0A8T0NKF8_PANVG|nr:hypothetical protein PVAP13_9KG270013 [Panicum virgatum]